MSNPHNHEEWSARRAKYNADWKDNQQAKKKHNSEANSADPPKKSAGRYLSLAKSFKYELATQVLLFDQEANQLV